MENTIELLNSNSATYYITDDINIDLLKTNQNVKISHYFNTHSLGCSQVIAHATRITVTSLRYWMISTQTTLPNTSKVMQSSLTFLIIYQSLLW